MGLRVATKTYQPAPHATISQSFTVTSRLTPALLKGVIGAVTCKFS
jgi:hypothetical protein